MAKLSLATNFDDSLLKEISRLNAHFSSTGNRVTEVFGSLPSTFGYNSGRSAMDIPFITFKQLEEHVKLAHTFGLTFNYILNEVCLGGMEYEMKGFNKIFNFIERLAKIKIDIITVSKPFLAHLITKHYSNFVINASVICKINSLQKVKEWIDLGVNRLNLRDVSRNFVLLKNIKKITKVEIELRANSACQSGSSFCYPHYIERSHTVKVPFVSYLLLNCKLARLKNPIDYLLKHGTWIRPEDLGKYDKVGVNIYKILDRTCTTKELLVRAKAYLSGSYKGNLLSILGNDSFEHFYLDNRKLDGFIDRFIKTKCPSECKNCDYCKKVAAHSLKLGCKKKIRKAIKNYEEMINFYF